LIRAGYHTGRERERERERGCNRKEAGCLGSYITDIVVRSSISPRSALAY